VRHSRRAGFDHADTVDARLPSRARVPARTAILRIFRQIDLTAIGEVTIAVAKFCVASTSTAAEPASRRRICIRIATDAAGATVHQICFEVRETIAATRAAVALARPTVADLARGALVAAGPTILAVTGHVDFATGIHLRIAIGKPILTLEVAATGILAAVIHIRGRRIFVGRIAVAESSARATVVVVRIQLYAVTPAGGLAWLAPLAGEVSTDGVPGTDVATGGTILFLTQRSLAAVFDTAVAVCIKGRAARHLAGATDADPLRVELGVPPGVRRALVSAAAAVLRIVGEIDVAEEARSRARRPWGLALVARAHVDDRSPGDARLGIASVGATGERGRLRRSSVVVEPTSEISLGGARLHENGRDSEHGREANDATLHDSISLGCSRNVFGSRASARAHSGTPPGILARVAVTRRANAPS